jgi:hypothetical protein
MRFQPGFRFQPAAGGGLLLDALGTAAVRAYSLRKLRAAYAGSAIRVRRSNDNAEADIGFDGSGDLDTAALATHVSSNSGYVTTWYDQTATGDNMVNATAAEQPRIVNAGTNETNNALPVLLLGHATQVSLIAGTSFSCFEALGIASAQGATFSEFWGLLESTGGSHFLLANSGAATLTEGQQFTTVVVDNGNETCPMNDILFQVNGFRGSGATMNLPLIGYEPSQGNSRRWQGDIGELILFDANLSAGDRTTAYTDMKAYWGTA